MDSVNETPLLYRQRPHTLAPEVEFSLDRGVLSWTDSKGRSGAISVGDIRDLRIIYDPSRLLQVRWVVDIIAQDKEEIRFTSTSLMGGSFRARTTVFLPFLAALHQELARAKPNIACHIGPNGPSYVIRCLLWWLPVCAMVWTASHGFTDSALSTAVFFGFLALYSGQFAIKYSYYNFPRRYRPDAPPLHLLPKPSERDV